MWWALPLQESESFIGFSRSFGLRACSYFPSHPSQQHFITVLQAPDPFPEETLLRTRENNTDEHPTPRAPSPKSRCLITILDWPQRASNGQRLGLWRPAWSRALIGGANQLMVVGPRRAAHIKGRRGAGDLCDRVHWDPIPSPIFVQHRSLRRSSGGIPPHRIG
jgi:hypothetical protein